jgi:hypothetical protein
MKTCGEPGFIDFGSRWKSVVSFTFLTLYPKRKAFSSHWMGPKTDFVAVAYQFVNLLNKLFIVGYD